MPPVRPYGAGQSNRYAVRPPLRQALVVLMGVSMRLVICGLIIFVAGCNTEEIVYVPADDFEQRIELSSSTNRLKVDEILELKVKRWAGPWVERKISLVNTEDPNTCWHRGSAPPTNEREVSSNISFTVTPNGNQRFNVGHEALEGRTVLFTEPGIYKLQGHSAVWCVPGSTSKTIEIEVVK